MKKSIGLLMAVILLLSACSSAPTETDPPQTTQAAAEEQVGTVGISLPDSQVSRWPAEAAALMEKLEDQQIKTVVEYAEGDSLLQAEQIGQMIDRKVDCIVVAAVDSLLLNQVLIRAQTEEIPVIAYDRLLMQTQGVTGCVALDSEAAGEAIGQYIAVQKQLETAQTEGRSYTVEFFMDTPEDHNSVLFHQGLLGVLQPYLDTGVLICNSGRVGFEDTCIQSGGEASAVQTCESIIAQFYTEAMPDILCAATDALAGACAVALEKAGCLQDAWPLITGAGAQQEAVSRIASGQQSVTMVTDSQELAYTCVEMVMAVLRGNPLPQTTQLDNGIVLVPANLCRTLPVDAQNYRQVLMENGYFTEDDIT